MVADGGGRRCYRSEREGDRTGGGVPMEVVAVAAATVVPVLAGLVGGEGGG